MGNPRQCANCKAALPPDQPPDHHYCESCAAAWERGEGFTAEALSLKALVGSSPTAGVPGHRRSLMRKVIIVPVRSI